ncbi:hypothetical protein V2W45_1342497 [Cenococcum geophilum]
MSRDDDQGVNYKYPLRLFRSLLQHHSFKYDNIYNWTVLKYIEHLEKQGVTLEDEITDTRMSDPAK